MPISFGAGVNERKYIFSGAPFHQSAVFRLGRGCRDQRAWACSGLWHLFLARQISGSGRVRYLFVYLKSGIDRRDNCAPWHGCDHHPRCDRGTRQGALWAGQRHDALVNCQYGAPQPRCRLCLCLLGAHKQHSGTHDGGTGDDRGCTDQCRHQHSFGAGAGPVDCLARIYGSPGSCAGDFGHCCAHGPEDECRQRACGSGVYLHGAGDGCDHPCPEGHARSDHPSARGLCCQNLAAVCCTCPVEHNRSGQRAAIGDHHCRNVSTRRGSRPDCPCHPHGRLGRYRRDCRQFHRPPHSGPALSKPEHPPNGPHSAPDRPDHAAADDTGPVHRLGLW